MYRHILVATDLTRASMPALRTAFSLAFSIDARLTVLHVTEPPYPAHHWFVAQSARDQAWLRELAASERDAAARLVDSQIAEARSPEHETVVVDKKISSGIPADEILAVARDVGADLIVMGTHGRRGIQHLTIGSIAERTVRTAPCAVLTVRAERAT
jgi:nucleotide-binding universal stress UspA family protein